MAINLARFHDRVYTVIRAIPEGQVTSYGHIAKLVGHPTYSRMVGAALRDLQDPTVPWHRVLSSTGSISSRGDGGPASVRQRLALEAEGVEVEGGTEREGGRVRLGRWGWFPDSFDFGDDDDEVEGEGEE